MSLRDTWKQTGSNLGHAFRDLGKALTKTASNTAKKVDNWANSDEQPQQEQPQQEQPQQEQPQQENP